MRRAAAPAALALLVLAACSRGGDDPRALTADQEQQLNQAAEMLDANSVALEEVAANGEQP